MKSTQRSIIVSGSSITDWSAWPTWATWINHRYNPDFFINCGVKGIGNELILLKAVAEAKKHENPVVVVQLTNIDKWDWYVENTNLVTKLIQEKHSLIKLSPDDDHGFWSTGSHFPKWKEYYKNNYFSLEHSTYQTLQLIQWFQLLCQQQHWKYYIIFDSPIFSVTESYLNTGNLTVDECYTTGLVNNTLTSSLFDLVDFNNIYMPGIIGYAKINSYPWYTKKVKGHPGSLIHYQFTKDIICPALDQIIEPFQSLDPFKDEAGVFQNLFNNL
jgi:hypothetical protein